MPGMPHRILSLPLMPRTIALIVMLIVLLAADCALRAGADDLAQPADRATSRGTGSEQSLREGVGGQVGQGSGTGADDAPDCHDHASLEGNQASLGRTDR
jgi:hypothetical protein